VILLDTNVLSELMRSVPSRQVLSWYRHQSPVHLATTAICAAELFAGVAGMPAGRRRDSNSELVAALLDVELDGRVIPFDSAAAIEYAYVLTERRKLGQEVEFPDAQIAAIARVHSATLATRNVKDFSGVGLDVVDPWR
jgi:predicted nucleic acid-binding protein